MEPGDEFITQVLTTIDEADVLTIFFPNLSKSLVVDARRNFEESPIVQIMNQVSSMKERMSAIEKMRPGLGRVRSISGIPWTKSIRTLKENGILDRLKQRLVMSGEDSQAALDTCETAFMQLQQIEHKQWVELIKGKNPHYKSIWQTGNKM